MREGEAIRARKPRKLWSRPLVWATAATAVLALVIMFAVTGVPGQSPLIEPPYPSLPDTPPSITPPPLPTDPAPPADPAPPTDPAPLPATGFLRILVTDAPPQREVTELHVILSNTRVSKYAADEDDGAWITVFAGEKEFDLIKLRDLDLAEVLGEAELETGEYGQIRLSVEILYARIDGEDVTMGVMLPGGILRLVPDETDETLFEIRGNETTVVTIDFDADKSLVFTGTDLVIFKPVVKLIIDYE